MRILFVEYLCERMFGTLQILNTNTLKVRDTRIK